MDENELRAEFAALRNPAAPIPVPPLRAVRRRLRRHRATQATAGLLACGCAAVLAGLISHAAGRQPLIAGSVRLTPACTSGHIAARWLPPVVPRGTFMDPPPTTHLLVLRNIGAKACTVSGWPVLSPLGSRLPHGTSISYGTVAVLYPQNARQPRARTVEPTTVLLRPGAAAASAVTVSTPAMLSECRYVRWAAYLPRAAGSWLRVHDGAPQVCGNSSIVVSPAYPANAQLTGNYPKNAPPTEPGYPAEQPPPAPPAGPATAPDFVIIDRAEAPAPALVREWASGRLLATLRPPAWAGATGFTGVAAAGDDRTFVLAAGQRHSRFYEYRLVRGHLQDRVLLPVPPGISADAPFALSPDGTKLAIAQARPGRVRKVIVVWLATGAFSTWTASSRGAITTVAWAGNSRLAFSWYPGAGTTDRAMRAGLHVIDTTGPGTSLASSKLLVPAAVRFGSLRSIFNPLFSADGARLFATMTRTGIAPQAAVVEFSGRTGRPLRVVTPPAGESGMGTWCGAVWSDPSGVRAMAVCRVQGVISDGRFSPVNLHFPAPNFSSGPDFFGW